MPKIREEHWIWILLISVFCIAVLPRIIQLDAFLSPDEFQWERNTLGFREAVSTKHWRGLYQQPHPGITTMWLAAPVIEYESWSIRRLPHAVAVSALIVAATYISIRLWGVAAGTGAGLLLAIDPHFIAHSRVLAMDALLSIFLLISVLAFLAWKKQSSTTWLIVSGAAGAAAVLSKLSGIIILPFIFLLGMIEIWLRSRQWRSYVKNAAWWMGGFIVAACVIFPTLMTDGEYVLEESRLFFGTEWYVNAVHAHGAWWYPEAIALWSTPLQMLGITATLFVLSKASRQMRGNILILLAFATAFFLFMQFSVKKGDRYLLPFFLFWDVLAAIGLVHATTIFTKWKNAIVAITAIAIVWQIWNIWYLHPHYLAYRNPVFATLAEGRTMGWGEGLDMAAHYLNTKPNAEDMLVIAYYEGPFSLHFKGTITSAERLDKETAEEIGGDYVVLYRTMEGRAADRWETRVLANYENKTPEHIISLNGEEYVWIYPVTPSADATSARP